MCICACACMAVYMNIRTQAEVTMLDWEKLELYTIHISNTSQTGTLQVQIKTSIVQHTHTLCVWNTYKCIGIHIIRYVCPVVVFGQLRNLIVVSGLTLDNQKSRSIERVEISRLSRDYILLQNNQQYSRTYC